MSLADVRDDSNRRANDLRQAFNLTEPAHSDFDDRRAIFFAEPEQSHRDADFVVEVARSLLDVAQPVQCGGSQIFCGGLAVGAGDRDHGDVEAIAPRARDFSVSRQRVVDLQDNAVDFFVEAFADENGRRAFFE